MASGNPAKKASERKISAVGDFKKRITSIEELPSGMVVKLRNPGGLQAFLGKGSSIIPNSLMPIIQDALAKGKAPDTSQIMPEGKIDEKILGDMINMMDQIAMQCMVEPKLYAVPTAADIDPDSDVEDPEELRRDDRLYVDELPSDDKQYIFAWMSGGVTDLETFRERQQSDLDALA